MPAELRSGRPVTLCLYVIWDISLVCFVALDEQENLSMLFWLNHNSAVCQDSEKDKK